MVNCLNNNFQLHSIISTEDDDDEFNVTDELERLLRNEYPEEYRMDRTTEIPRTCLANKPIFFTFSLRMGTKVNFGRLPNIRGDVDQAQKE